MDSVTRLTLDNLRSSDRKVQTTAFFAVIEMTDKPVEWAYEVWDDLVAMLKHKDNHQRSIAAQMLSNLAKSDLENRMLRDFDALLAVTKDKGFVTARHSLQAIWKVGVGGKRHQQMVVDALTKRFHECVTEKNSTLIRYDIIDDLRKMYDVVSDETIRETALALIETEQDLKYRKKYAGVWRTQKGTTV